MKFLNNKTGENIEIDFRLYQSKDEAQFVSCITDFYGDGYPYKEFLDGDFLDKQCKYGKMLIVCGETAEGEMVSVSAINFDGDFKKSGILMLRVVKKDFQNFGIGNKHQDFLFEQIKNMEGQCSLYADVMSHNTTSQNSLIREDFTCTGIRLMLYHNKIMLPDYPRTHDYKLSQVVMCKKISCDWVGEIFCPSRHKEFILDMYKKLGSDCEINTVSYAPLTKNSNIKIEADDLHNNLQLVVLELGEDFKDIIIDQLLKYKDTAEQTYMCYLNMKIKESVYAYDILSENGFFLTGTKPLNHNGEFMILSKVSGEHLDINEIMIHKSGEHILEYILKNRY
jgi:hypothetical protein